LYVISDLQSDSLLNLVQFEKENLSDYDEKVNQYFVRNSIKYNINRDQFCCKRLISVKTNFINCSSKQEMKLFTPQNSSNITANSSKQMKLIHH
jgi:hypothetical protein